jgi:hypothetical protein
VTACDGAVSAERGTGRTACGGRGCGFSPPEDRRNGNVPLSSAGGIGVRATSDSPKPPTVSRLIPPLPC